MEKIIHNNNKLEITFFIKTFININLIKLNDIHLSFANSEDYKNQCPSTLRKYFDNTIGRKKLVTNHKIAMH